MTFERPSGAYSGADGLNNRTKFQADAAAEPKVAISSSKMDGEFNYLIDALNSIDAAKGTTESIDVRISTILNADGTLKSSIAASLDDWVTHGAGNLQRVDGTLIRMDGDQTGLYPTGRRLRLVVAGAPLYADVVASTYTTFTTVQLTNIVTNSGAATTISTHPTSIAYAPTVPGVTGNETRVVDLLQLSTDYRITTDAASLFIQKNIGDVSSPNWSTIGSFTANGITLDANSIALDKLARAGDAGQILTSNGAGSDASFQTLYGVPTGAIQPFAGNITPAGWLICDGSFVSRTTYSALFNTIGVTYGAGDGSTTFALPDLRGRSVFGLDASAGRLSAASALGAAGGASSVSGTTDDHTLTIDEIPSHTHGIEDATGANVHTWAGGAGGPYASWDLTQSTPSTTPLTTRSTGGSQGHNHELTVDLMNPFLAMQWMIRT